MYSSTLSLTSALDGVGGQRHFPVASPDSNGAGGLVSPRAGLDECENLTNSGTRSPVYPYRVAVPTALSRPTQYKYISLNCNKITKVSYFSASRYSCHALGLTYTNTLFDLLASNIFHTAASISARSTKSTVMKSGERGGQTIRPLGQHTALQRGHSALQMLLQITRRPALLEHNASL
jgi:hypothetical protein